MDISRPDIKRKKTRRQIVVGIVAAIVLAGVAFAVSRLKPAAPAVERGTVWTDTVKRGPLLVQVRGLGTLVPREESIQLIPAQTDATVVRIRVLPGTKVTPDTILMDLVDPELQQKLLDAQLALKGAESDYKSLHATLQSTLMDKKAAAAAVNSAYTQDELQAKTDKQLYDLGVISGLTYNASKNTADQLTIQQKISQEQIDMNTSAIEVQLASQRTKIDQAKALLDLY
jgi:HlyD family secretion protein